MRRFFFNPNLAQLSSDSSNSNPTLTRLSQLAIGSLLNLTDDIYHHWCRVLRAKVGEQSLVFDGLGGQSIIELESIDKKSAQARIISHDTIDNRSNFHSTIAIVMSRGDRMDYAIQKSTELGATTIQLLTSQHGEVRLKANQVDKKLNHWQQVALSACEQCGLNRPPLVMSPVSIEQWLQQQGGEPHNDVSYLVNDAYYQQYFNQPTLPLVLAVPNQQEKQQLDINASIKQHFTQAVQTQSKPRFDILIGAEGGLSESEYLQARDSNYLPWQLGNRVLRTETAPVVALATLMHIGDTV
ncbi:16S rRNA (uracil(1498)-N(3))-methyltransferase [Psychrobacter phenylpyruvicus]|uniref:Ribosomal RNA small subunit methyltransferase E n=1 Tax=Psychrobacter phenylpyruvicus TaxID=29432 RepID=A0A379LMX0_9GAMM|nr:16S rRNA (uracil(1498)-N(3))-methyltransferase [Psychrobacter phenylpyruvicus]SUD91122.1 Ribosomal RNA small subunit methyltransferase E [Psychrobacter phenylpyruvicus]